MGTVIATALFWIATISAIVAQVMILRSSQRTLRGAAAPGADSEPASDRRARPIEWAFAILPALAVALLLYFTWRAATAPPVIQVEFP